jgi:hypothetical protein
MSYRSPTAWLASLPDQIRKEAEALTAKFTTLGASDPENWARSELTENIPQLTRFLILRSILQRHILPWTTHTADRLQQLASLPSTEQNNLAAAAGAAIEKIGTTKISQADLGVFAAAVALETAFNILNTIDEGHDPDAGDDSPGWTLMETSPDGVLTGREVGDLHESLFEI